MIENLGLRLPGTEDERSAVVETTDKRRANRMAARRLGNRRQRSEGGVCSMSFLYF